MAVWNILQIFGIFYDHLVHFEFIWCIFSGLGIMYQEKSGNPGLLLDKKLANFSMFCKLGRVGIGNVSIS
jgi:hypothetical protein